MAQDRRRKPARPRRTPAGRGPLLESLEQRLVMSFTWTSQEVYLVELVNRARSDPDAEAVRTGVDLTADLTDGELDHLIPTEPLALNEALTLAARQHSQDMSVRDFFDHENPDGDRAQERADANGYDGSAGENIAAGWDTIDAAHVAWLDSVGHRKNVLSLWESFRSNFHYDEIGVGFFFPESGVSEYDTYYTQVFGYSGTPQRTYILGVVYDDDDTDDFYSVGEGRAGVRVDVTDADSGLLVGSYLTDEAGNYQIAVPAGDYTVTFVDTGTGLGRQVTTAVVYNTNVKIDTTGDQLADPIGAADNLAGDNANINGSAGADGQITVTTLNPTGRPIAFLEDDGGQWSAVDLQTLTGSPALTGQVRTYTDPRDGLTYAAAPSADGLLLFRRSDAGGWTVRNLNDEITGAGLIDEELTVFISRGNKVHIAGLDRFGELHLYNQTGDTNDDGAAVWVSRNLSDTDIPQSGKTTPAFAGPLTSFVTGWNALNIVGLDASGDIQAVWFHSSTDYWTVSNLSDSTGAPPLTGGLTAYLTSWNAINLVGTDADGNVSATWWVPSFGASWTTSNLTDIIGGPRLQASSMTSFVTSWGATNIAGLDADGKLSVYWWSRSSNRWAITYLSDIVTGSELPAGELSGLTVSTTGSINIFGAADDGGVLRYWWAPDQNWGMQNLSDLT
ncbi:MAG: hypothetical protein IT431_12960 [Phycisphaerales bacterium]|nr:hypothetical protein [Phycisphaerales bacterium]